MQYWINKNNFLTLLLLIFCLQNSFAQENSPYSRYGLGNVRDQENIANRGMGGVSIADDNAQIANPTNPATYTGLKLASYQVGLVSHLATLKSENASNKVGYSTLAYVNIGFPISKNMGFSFGLLPVTSARYNMQTVDSNKEAQSLATHSYYGGGGIQKVYIGTAYKIGDVSIGVNGGYQFGNITNSSESSFTDSLYILSNNIYGRTVLGGFFWQVGGLYTKALKHEYIIKIGATYHGATYMNAKKESHWESFLEDNTSPVYAVDSIVNKKGKVLMPQKIALGVMLAHGDHWQIGADYNFANWKSYTSYGFADSMDNSSTFKIGGSFVPDVNSVNSYWKRMTFRAGFYTGKDIFNFRNTHLSKTAGTLGIGYPIRRTNNTIGQINLAVEIGSRGTTNNQLIKENFTHLSLGFTFNDKWFLKRRYD